MRALIAGNWKMNGLGAQLAEVEAVASGIDRATADVLVCPPATLLSRATATARGRIAIGGQDCHGTAAGAFTGDVSAEMLKDAGAGYVIVGHSERRQYHAESDAQVAAKAAAAWRAGLIPIVCVGETEVERDAGKALQVVARQLAGSIPGGAAERALVIAYEPVWAIGTGRTPSSEEIVQMHAFIRAEIIKAIGENGRKVPILYGGSVKPSNAKEILSLPEVGGALVGGASLKATDFLEIVRAAPAKP